MLPHRKPKVPSWLLNVERHLRPAIFRQRPSRTRTLRPCCISSAGWMAAADRVWRSTCRAGWSKSGGRALIAYDGEASSTYELTRHKITPVIEALTSRNPISGYNVTRRLAQVIRDQKVDLVHTQNATLAAVGEAAARKAGAKMIATFCDGPGERRDPVEEDAHRAAQFRPCADALLPHRQSAVGGAAGIARAVERGAVRRRPHALRSAAAWRRSA